MKKLHWLILLVIFITLTTYLNGQNTVATESKRIAVSVQLPSNSPLKGDATQVLYNRLNQAVVLNGLGSVSNSAKFVLVPIVTILSKDVTTQIPQQVVVEVEIALFLVDNSRKIILQQEAIQVKGIGQTEDRAINKAMTSVQARNPRLKNLIVKGKEKIVAYYEDQCDILMKSIQSNIDRKMYFEAYFELNSIPYLIENVSCYEKSLEMLKQLDDQIIKEAEEQLENTTSDVDWVNNGGAENTENEEE